MNKNNYSNRNGIQHIRTLDIPDPLLRLTISGFLELAKEG